MSKIPKIEKMRELADELEIKYTIIHQLNDLGVPKTTISKRVGIKRPTVYNILADPETRPVENEAQ